MVMRFMQRGPQPVRRVTPARELLQRRQPAPVQRGPITRGPAGPMRPLGSSMDPMAILRQHLASRGVPMGMGSPGPSGPDVMGRIRDVVRPGIGGLASGVGSALAKAAIPDVDSLIAQANARSSARMNAMSQLNGLAAPVNRTPNPLPAQSRTPGINPMYVPGAGSYKGPPISPGLGGLANQSPPPPSGAPSPGLGGGSMDLAFRPQQQAQQSSMQGFSGRGDFQPTSALPPAQNQGMNTPGNGDFGTVPGGSSPNNLSNTNGMGGRGGEYGGTGFPPPIGVVPAGTPGAFNPGLGPSGMPHSMDQSGPGPLINGTMVPGASPMGGIPSPGLGGAVGQTSGLGMPNSMNQTGPNQASGVPAPVPGTAGAPTPSPGLGGVVGQGVSQSPAASPAPGPAGGTGMPPTPAASPGGQTTIPNPRAGMPNYPAASGPSQRPSMVVPPWVYQQQPIQIPGNILAGNPNLANLAPGGQVDVSAAMGPIWGPINKGQLPGGLAGQMFQGTIDPRTGQSLGSPGGAPAALPGNVGGNAGGINASLVPGAGGPVPQPGLGGVPAGGVLGAPAGTQPGVPSTTQPGIGGVPAVGAPSIPNVAQPGAPAPAAPVQTGLPTGVRSARDILASRLGGVPGAAPVSSVPTGASPSSAPAPAGGVPATGAAPAAAPVQPGAVGSSGIWDPQGQASPPVGGGSWDQINQYDPSIAKWTQQMGRPDLAPVIKGMIAVESGGQNISGGEPGSTGILQIMPAYWSDTAQKLGVDLNTPDGQIAVATAILAGQSGHGDQGSWQANFQSMFFPQDDPSSGMTQANYTQWLQSMYDQGQQQGGGTAGPLNKTTIPGTTSGSGSGTPTSGQTSGTVSPVNAPTTTENSGVADPAGQQIVDFAKQYLGTPYTPGEIGTNGPGAGWDCSGYVWWVAQQKGYTDVPHGSHFQYQWAQQNGTLQTQGPIGIGDMVFFATLPQGSDCSAGGDNGCNINAATHVGIYAGKDQNGNDIFLNALNPSIGTVQSTLADMGNPQVLGWAAF